MPQCWPRSWREDVSNAKTQSIMATSRPDKATSRFNKGFGSVCTDQIENDGGGMAGALLSDRSSQPGSSGKRKVNGRTIPVGTAGFTANWRERYRSAILRYSHQWGIWLGFGPASGHTVHQEHPIRRWFGRGCWTAGFDRPRKHVQTVCRFLCQTEQRPIGFVFAGASTNQRKETPHSRQSRHNIGDRFLNPVAGISQSLAHVALAFLIMLMFASTIPISTANAAASLIIKPTRVIITEGAPVVAVTVQNQGTSDAVIQMDLMTWSQASGEDVFGPTDDLQIMACPPLFTVKPGESQIVRVGLENIQRDWEKEGTFRLFIQEIPPEPVEGDTAVQVALRISVPVFLPPKNAGQPAMDWHIEQRGEGGVWMTASNKGDVHALITGLQLNHDANTLFQVSTHQYVLPGATIAWRLNTTQSLTGELPEMVEMLAATDQGVYEQSLSIGK